MATYVPNATTTSEPTASREVASAAEEFRVLKTYTVAVEGRMDAAEADVVDHEARITAAELALTNIAAGTDSTALAAALASSAVGDGASMIGVQDSANNFSAANAEAVFTELALRIGQVAILATEPRFGALADSNGT